MRGVAQGHQGRLQSFRFFREDNGEGDRKPVPLHVPRVEKGAASTWERQTRTRKVILSSGPDAASRGGGRADRGRGGALEATFLLSCNSPPRPRTGCGREESHWTQGDQGHKRAESRVTGWPWIHTERKPTRPKG